MVSGIYKTFSHSKAVRKARGWVESWPVGGRAVILLIRGTLDLSDLWNMTHDSACMGSSRHLGFPVSVERGERYGEGGRLGWLVDGSGLLTNQDISLVRTPY